MTGRTYIVTPPKHDGAEARNAPISVWVGGAHASKLVKAKWPAAILVKGDFDCWMFSKATGHESGKGRLTKGFLYDLRKLDAQSRLAMAEFLDVREALHDFSREPAEVIAAKANQYG
jgi:hypothetical protein